MPTPVADRLIEHLQTNPEQSTLQLAIALNASYWEVAFVLQRLEIERRVRVSRRTGQPALLGTQVVEESEALWNLFQTHTPVTRLGAAIRARRLELDLSLRALASQLDIKFSTLSKYETKGNEFIPSPDLLQKIEEVLRFRRDELFVLAEMWPPDLQPTRGAIRSARMLGGTPGFLDLMYSITHHHDAVKNQYFYRVELGDDLWFEVYEVRGEYNLLDEILRVSPAIINLDFDLAESYDDAGRTQPRASDSQLVRKFTQKWKGHFRGSNITFGGFPHTGY